MHVFKNIGAVLVLVLVLSIGSVGCSSSGESTAVQAPLASASPERQDNSNVINTDEKQPGQTASAVSPQGPPIARENAGQVKEINARELAEMISSTQNLFLIDVSTPGEYKEGHIKGSLPGDLRLLRTRPEQYLESLGAMPSDAIVLICETGSKSYRVAEVLLGTKYQNVYNLAGGKIDWVREGFDLVTEDGKS
ncbi:rhodanese-like domain-containing protein [Desulfofundulus salinus]|nr:rhodanese-like domain-containing protein [Desulfofundulus salinum]